MFDNVNEVKDKIKNLDQANQENISKFIKELLDKNQKTTTTSDVLPLMFFIVVIILGFMTKNMTSFGIQGYIGMYILLISSLYTINKNGNETEKIKKMCTLVVLIFTLIHLSPMIRHNDYQKYDINSILSYDKQPVNKFILLTILTVPTILMYLEFFGNTPEKTKNKVTRGIIIAWAVLFIYYLFNIPDGLQLKTGDDSSLHRQEMYKQFLSRYTLLSVCFLFLFLSSPPSTNNLQKDKLVVAFLLVIVANITSRIFNKEEKDGSSFSGVLTPNNIPESLQIIITIALLGLLSFFSTTKFKFKKLIFLTLTTLVSGLIIYFTMYKDPNWAGLPGVVIAIVLGIFVWVLLMSIGSKLLNISNTRLFKGIITLITIGFIYFFIDYIKSVRITTDTENSYRLIDSIDLTIQIAAQFILLCFIALCLSSDGNKTYVKMAIGLFVIVSLAPIAPLASIVLSGGGAFASMAHGMRYNSKNLSTNFNDLKKGVSNELGEITNSRKKEIDGSDVDKFLMNEIKQTIKIMNNIEQKKLLEK